MTMFQWVSRRFETLQFLHPEEYICLGLLNMK